MGSIYTCLQNKDLYIIVEGKGTAEYCSELNACIQEVMSGMEIERVYFDMQSACYVDSSFIGLILSVKKKFKSQENSVCLLNPSDKIVDIFQIMGLDSFIPSCYQVSTCDKESGVEIHQKLENSISDIKLLLESHQNIMETNAENKKRFTLVEKVFLKELKQRQAQG